MYKEDELPASDAGPGGGPHAIKELVSVMNAFGIADQTFGDGSATGPWPEIRL